MRNLIRNNNKHLIKSRKEISRLKDIIEKQEEKIAELIASIVRISSSKEYIKNQSKSMINKFVKQLIDDEGINIKGVPDCLERKIYENVLTIVINVIEKVLDTSSITLLNHKIIFNIEPLE